MMSPLVPMFDAMDALAAETLLAPRSACRLECNSPQAREAGDTYEVCVRAPGVAPSDVTIEAANGRLRVYGKTKTAAHTHFVDYTIALPDDADTHEASASGADGLITLCMPKKEAEPATHIEVSTAEGMRTEATEADTPPRYTLTIVAAGMAPSDLCLSVEKGVLKVSGSTQRTGAKLDRSYRLPKDADASSAHASCVDGILTITIPKKPAAEATRIAVKTTGADAAEDENEMGVMV